MAFEEASGAFQPGKMVRRSASVEGIFVVFGRNGGSDDAEAVGFANFSCLWNLPDAYCSPSLHG